MGRRFVCLLLSLTLLSAGALADEGPGAAEPGKQVQRLAQLIRAAERYSPGVRAARHNISAANALFREAKGSPFMQFNATGVFGVGPNVRGTSIYTTEDNPLGFGGEGGWDVVTAGGVSGAIPLYTWGKIREARKATKAGMNVAEGSRDRVMNQLRFDVRRAYFGLQFALDVRQLILEGKGKLIKALEQLNQRIEDGDSNTREEDRWRMSSTIAEVEAREAEAIQLERSARAALQVLTNIADVQVEDCPSQRIDYDPKPLTWYLDGARLNRPEGRMLDGAVRARKSATAIASARFFPDLGLALSVGGAYAPGRTKQNNPFVPDPANRANLSAGLAARWSLDMWGSHFKTQRAKAQLSATEAMREQAHDGISIEVTAAYEALKATQTTEVAWGRGHRDTRAWFLAAAQAHQMGVNEPRDLVDAVRAYLTARVAHLNAIRAHNTGMAELERTVGSALIAEEDAWEPRCD